MAASNLLNQRFGRLLVLERRGSDKYGNALWYCKCDCGGDTTVGTTTLRNGSTQSCSCLMRERAAEARKTAAITHGLSRSSEYNTWSAMLQRCYSTECKNYYRYGGRGITMSDEWKNSFEAFYRDMGPKPSESHSIERERNNEGYSKENCKWATKQEQANNRNNSLFYEYTGETKTLKQWCDILGLHYSRVYHRIKVLGWDFEDAIQPIELYPVTFNNVTQSLGEWCMVLGLKLNDTYLRFLRGETLESIITNQVSSED